MLRDADDRRAPGCVDAIIIVDSLKQKKKIKRNWDDEHLTCDREHAIWASRLHILHQVFRKDFGIPCTAENLWIDWRR